MNTDFNLSGLKDIYNQALNKNELIISFELNNGKGRFLFIMFFNKGDKKTDKLYIFMKNTQKMLTLRLYGNHHKGDFGFYLNSENMIRIKAELMIGNNNSSNPFTFSSFIEQMNSSIPKNLPLKNSIETLRNSWFEIKAYIPKNIIDDNKKTELIGERSLPNSKKPQEKTLRKLYLYDNKNPENTTKFIENLKRLNNTVAWRVPKT